MDQTWTSLMEGGRRGGFHSYRGTTVQTTEIEGKERLGWLQGLRVLSALFSYPLFSNRTAAIE